MQVMTQFPILDSTMMPVCSSDQQSQSSSIFVQPPPQPTPVASPTMAPATPSSAFFSPQQTPFQQPQQQQQMLPLDMQQQHQQQQQHQFVPIFVAATNNQFPCQIVTAMPNGNFNGNPVFNNNASPNNNISPTFSGVTTNVSPVGSMQNLNMSVNIVPPQQASPSNRTPVSDVYASPAQSVFSATPMTPNQQDWGNNNVQQDVFYGSMQQSHNINQQFMQNNSDVSSSQPSNNGMWQQQQQQQPEFVFPNNNGWQGNNNTNTVFVNTFDNNTNTMQQLPLHMQPMPQQQQQQGGGGGFMNMIPAQGSHDGSCMWQPAFQMSPMSNAPAFPVSPMSNVSAFPISPMSTTSVQPLLLPEIDAQYISTFAREQLNFTCMDHHMAAQIAQEITNEDHMAMNSNKVLVDRSMRIRSKLIMAKKMADIQIVFDRFDLDRNGFLNQAEVQHFCKQEYGFDLTQEELERVVALVTGNANGMINVHQLADLRSKVSRVRWSRPRSASEISGAEVKAAALACLVEEAKAATVAATEQRDLAKQHVAASNIESVGECLRAAQSGQSIISKARTTVSSLRVTLDGSNHERLQVVATALSKLDEQLLAEQKEVKKVMSEIHRLRIAHGGDDSEPLRKKQKLDGCASDDCEEAQVTCRLRVRGTLFAMLRKIQSANLRNLRWSRLRAHKALDGALKANQVSPDEHVFGKARVDEEATLAAVRILVQHYREHLTSLADRGKPIPTTVQELVAGLTGESNDLGSYLAAFPSLRGSVRLLEECLERTAPEVWARHVLTQNPTYKCRLATPITYGAKMFSRVHRNLELGEVVTAIGSPCLVDGHQRIRIQLETGEEAFVSVRNNDKFFLLEVFDDDDADTNRWVHTSEPITDNVDEVFSCLRNARTNFTTLPN